MDIDHDPLTTTLLRLVRVQESHSALLQSIVSQQAAQARALEGLARRLDDNGMVHTVSGALRELVNAQQSQGHAILNLMGDVRAVMRAVGAQVPDRWGRPTMLPAVAEGTPMPKATVRPAPLGTHIPPQVTRAPATPESKGAVPLPLAGGIVKPTRTVETTSTPPAPLTPLPVTSQPKPRAAPTPKPQVAPTPKPPAVAPTSSPKTTTFPPSAKPKPLASTSNSASTSTTALKPIPKPKLTPKPDRARLRAEPPYCASWNEGNGACDPHTCPLLHECFACAAVGRPSKHRYHSGRCLKGLK
ncbi:uncharacterized protein LOC62_03G004343 [Vanrija pseudolonga]|uniref:C3H1-type domain-containing protein n=1 Tax=Vanrija pseudolonga TaxID=143232 RepID=A0AAF0Y661_9TREE|nr:hypothetical protein LOC62_03G004343 [Vanrija pseudolonga]